MGRHIKSKEKLMLSCGQVAGAPKLSKKLSTPALWVLTISDLGLRGGGVV